MLIKDLFTKPVDRPINGVIKADQDDAASVWQELDEYVVTGELDKHFRRFFDAFLKTRDNTEGSHLAGLIGVWISGFFGSGKSHFLKILSYLLENRAVHYQGQSRCALAFFDGKIQDAMLAADIKRAVSTPTDVILFNIDSKADSASERDAILRVFLKVFNEKLGYSGDYPHLADIERRLDALGKFADFKAAFRAVSGLSWEDERDGYSFYQEQIITALADTLAMTPAAARTWIEKSEADFDALLSVENFAGWVRDYLDSRSPAGGPDHRLVFLVDEIGQFIGQDTRLMLSLQTITENLGTLCNGRAWVVVTSQEDIDAILGQLRASQANDFSKIQGRFVTRLSLSSGNVDEVIQKRLLAKTAAAEAALAEVHAQSADILKNQLSFSQVGMRFKPFADARDFAAVYPFAPYQFQLVQKIFEAIRRHGVTGLHLARGERSMLDAFQSAATQLAEASIGVLVPLYRFYPAIESFLEGVVKSTIDQAARNDKLDPFDTLVLKTLFLIRYVDEMRGTLDNLITLFIDRIDADRLALRRQLETSLQRLERETLIGRNGEDFFFLTNEERDISREIKNVDLSSAEETKLLSELLFDDLLKGRRSHRFPDNGKDFGLTRLCDLHPHGTRTDGDLILSVITPLSDDYGLHDEARCILNSSVEGGALILKLADDKTLAREVRALLQTDKYVARKHDGTISHTIGRILRERQEENRERRERLHRLLDQLCAEASLYAAGQPLKPKAAGRSGSAPQVIAEGLNYLVRNSFTKLGYLSHLAANPQAEIKAVLSASDVDDLGFSLDAGQGNQAAITDLSQTIDLMSDAHHSVVLETLVRERYGRRPYGWPEWEVVLLIARLLRRGDISLVLDGDTLSLEKTYEPLTSPSKWRKLTIVKRKTIDSGQLQQARQLAKELFGRLAPDGEDAIAAHLREQFGRWRGDLSEYLTLTGTGQYPGGLTIAEALGVLKPLSAESDSIALIEQFLARESDLLDLADDIHELRHFYTHQRQAWDSLIDARQRFQANRVELEQDADAAAALKRIGEILRAPAPYGMVKEAAALIACIAQANDALIAAQRARILPAIDKELSKVQRELDTAQADQDLRNQCLYPLQQLKQQAESQTSLAHIAQAARRALELADAAFARIEAAIPPPPRKPGDAVKDHPDTPYVKPRRVIKAAALTPEGYLETQADVDGYLSKLRAALEKGIAAGDRIEIR
jgi:hypothetical protein